MHSHYGSWRPRSYDQARRSIKPLHEPFVAKARLGPLLVCEAGLLARFILEILPRTGTVTRFKSRADREVCFVLFIVYCIHRPLVSVEAWPHPFLAVS